MLTAKTKILTTNELYMSNASFIDIDGEFIDIIQSDASHTYLGWMLSLNANNRVHLEIAFRKRCAWSAFHQTQTNVVESLYFFDFAIEII